MSDASYSRSQIVNAAVAATQSFGPSTSGGTATLYTAPANGRAILNLTATMQSSGSGSVTVGGVSAVGLPASTTVTMTIHVGPGQSVALTWTPVGTGNGCSASVSGVEIKNG